MKFRITGAESRTGVDRSLVIEADDENQALDIAMCQGIFAYNVELFGDPEPPSPQSPSKPRRRRERDRVSAGGLVVALLIFLSCAGVWAIFNESSSRPSVQPESRPSVQPDPFRYDGATDRDLKKLPSNGVA